MRSEWVKYKIKEFSNVVGGGTPSTKYDQYYGGDVPWLTPKDMSIQKSKYISHGSRNITEQGLSKSSAKLVPAGTVLFTSRAPIGYIAIAKKEVSTNQGFKSLICNESLAHNEFLYYLLKHKTPSIEAIASGSTFKEVSGGVLKDFIVELPSLKTQKKIAYMLSTLDDKIELNRKMNQTLEEMAQALFKSWFVDFDPVHAKANAPSDADYDRIAKELGISREVLDLFPDEFEESELGMIPKYWEVRKLGQIGNVVTGKTPPTKNLENYGDKYQFITIPDMHNQIYIISTDRYLSETGHFEQVNKLIPINSLIVSCIATVGLVSINAEESHTNQQINTIVCDKKHLYYLYCMLSGMTDKLKMYGSAGTATLNVNKSIFESIKALLPLNNELQVYCDTVAPMFEQILTNTKQIQIFQKTRDILLPKLLSGELDVSELELDHVTH